MSNNADDATVALRGYKLFKRDREGRGGGVALYVKETFSCVNITIQGGYLEQISIDNVKYAIGVIYKPPRYSNDMFFQEFEDTLNIIVPQFDKIICDGDFNIDLGQIDSNDTKRFYNLIESYDMTQIINEPTRFSTSNASLIDLKICSNNIEIINSVGSNTPILADHCLISCQLKRENSEKHPFLYTYPNFRYFNYNNFLLD